MKTTVDISETLLTRAKRLAARRGVTLKTVLEDALRRELATHAPAHPRPAVSTHTFGGNGLQRGLDWSDWAAIRSMAYEGRGG